MDIKPHLLLVEDEAKVAAFIKKGLEKHSFAVEIAEDGRAGQQFFDQSSYDLLILDVRM